MRQAMKFGGPTVAAENESLVDKYAKRWLSNRFSYIRNQKKQQHQNDNNEP
jgi:hypothetical protein